MIEALKSDEIVHRLGGRFKVCALIQHRWVELIHGARPLVERRNNMTDLEVVVQEILEDGVDCALASSGDVAAFTARVCELIDQPQLVAQYAHAALQKVRASYSAAAMTHAVEAIYSKYLDDRTES